MPYEPVALADPDLLASPSSAPPFVNLAPHRDTPSSVLSGQTRGGEVGREVEGMRGASQVVTDAASRPLFRPVALTESPPVDYLTRTPDLDVESQPKSGEKPHSQPPRLRIIPSFKRWWDSIS
ncbi:hypothetical protein JCM11641_002552 [Rhodosporidiobolus odoratus]